MTCTRDPQPGTVGSFVFPRASVLGSSVWMLFLSLGVKASHFSFRHIIPALALTSLISGLGA